MCKNINYLAVLILQVVREKRRRLTYVSDICRINRKEFTEEGLAKMRLSRLTRILYALYLILEPEELEDMERRIHEMFKQYAEQYDEQLLRMM